MCLKIIPLIHFTRAIISKFSDMSSQPFRLLRFDLVKVVLCPRMMFYTCPIFADRFMVCCTHSDSSLPRSILSIFASPVLTLTGLSMIFVVSS